MGLDIGKFKVPWSHPPKNQLFKVFFVYMDVLSLGYGGEESTKFKVLRHGWLFVFVICVNGWINFTLM